MVEVKFEHDAEQLNELTLRVSDIIRNGKLVEDRWMEGELNGKRGIFSDNFVAKKEITPPPGVCVYICTYEQCMCLWCVCVQVYLCMYMLIMLIIHIICNGKYHVTSCADQAVETKT